MDIKEKIQEQLQLLLDCNDYAKIVMIALKIKTLTNIYNSGVIGTTDVSVAKMGATLNLRS